MHNHQSPVPARTRLLEEAIKITAQDRNKAYGAPEDSFGNIAAYWKSYFQQRFQLGVDITPQDVAHLMILMKMARLATNAGHRDSLVDVAGYAACAADCQEAAAQVQRLEPAVDFKTLHPETHC